MTIQYPNARDEDFRQERERLLGTPDGNSTANKVHACLLHAKEVRALRVLLENATNSVGIWSTSQVATFKGLLFELQEYKLRARRMNEDD